MERYLNQIRLIDQKVDLDSEFPDWNKAVQFVIDGEPAFYFVVQDGTLTKAQAGEYPNPDVTIKGSSQAISDLFDGKMAVVGGFITKELAIEGKVGDAIGANVLIQAARVF